ncbi:hypothetical protein BD289DRAFT_449814 [Coniella lustricola]|uniref:Uncharacterized protein n=1 Tax=Coniella lustricola TaxID=2025994 RepID=A0A2T3AKW9_9PEZI|nr:hypothetical protein BD289DRAFT_449814 [Coniella lustricola]
MSSINERGEQSADFSATALELGKPETSMFTSARLQELQNVEREIDDINNRLQFEVHNLNCLLYEEVSQRIIAVAQLQQLRKKHVALITTLEALWKLVQEGRPEFHNKSVQEMANRICSYAQLPSQTDLVPGGSASGADTWERLASLEREVASLRTNIKHYERLEASLRGKNERLTAANRQLKARMSLNDVERQQLQWKLTAAGLSLDLNERPMSTLSSFTAEH